MSNQTRKIFLNFTCYYEINPSKDIEVIYRVHLNKDEPCKNDLLSEAYEKLGGSTNGVDTGSNIHPCCIERMINYTPTVIHMQAPQYTPFNQFMYWRYNEE